MTLKAAIWVHGSIFKPEYPERITRSKPIGWGMEILGKAGTYNWFHIPISTPVIMDGARPRLSKIFVFYNSATQAITKAALTDVHIYDGKNKVITVVPLMHQIVGSSSRRSPFIAVSEYRYASFFQRVHYMLMFLSHLAPPALILSAKVCDIFGMW